MPSHPIHTELCDRFALVQGHRLNKELSGTGLGFALLVFDYGDTGTMAYACSAQRAQMIAAVRELLAKLEAAG